MNKTKIKNKNKSKLISMLLISVVILTIYYLYSFLTRGLLVYYGYSITNLTSIIYPIILIILICVTAISLSLIIYGYIRKKIWTIKLELMYTMWIMLWLIWGLIVSSQIIENLLLILVFGLISICFVSSYVREHFKLVKTKSKKRESKTSKGIRT